MFALTQGLRRAVQIKPHGIATHFAGRQRTWQQSLERISRVGGALSALGVRPGDRVAILALNSDRYFELMYAIPWIGAAMVPLNTRLAAPELDYILSDSGAVALFVDTAMAHHLSALDGKIPGVREVVWMDDSSSPEGMLRFEDLANYEAADDAGADDDDLAGLFYTGGTTGRAKGVMLTHSNLVVNALNGVAGIGFNAETTYIHSGPMFHLADGASTFGVTMSGGRHAFVPRFEPVEVLQTIQTEKVTHAQFVPTMINMLVNHPRFGEFDISTLSFILYGASPMPEGVLRKAMQVMPQVRLMHAYGMTEAAPIVTLLDPRYTTLDGPFAGKLKSCGQVGAGLRGQGGRRQPQGGGLRHGGRTRDPRRQHHEGLLEQARRDRRGARERLVLLGRRRHHGRGRLRLYRRSPQGHDHLRRRERLFGRGRERALADGGRGEVAVIGVPDERWGERVHAIVVPKPGARLTAEDVMEHCREQIAGYKCPRSVDFRDTPLPLSGAGKVLKRELREPYWKGFTKAVN